jgi:hypothetical protein
VVLEGRDDNITIDAISETSSLLSFNRSTAQDYSSDDTLLMSADPFGDWDEEREEEGLSMERIEVMLVISISSLISGF